MKKFFKILAIVILVLVALIIALPFVFQGKIVQIVKDEINKSVNARVDFSSARLSLIRSFPDFSLSLNKLEITGNEPFAGDTLFYTDNLRLTVDLGSVFRGSPYEIKSVSINNPALNLMVLADGSYNWDIMLPVEELPEAAEELPPDEDALFFNLKALTLNNGRVRYDDKEMDFVLLLTGLDGQLSGSLSMGLSDIYAQATAKNLVMIYEDLAVLSGVKADYKGVFVVDLDNDYYSMRENRVYLNKLGIDVDGGFGFVDDGITMAINFESADKSFKNLLSLIPAMYARDFEQVRTDGQFALKGHITGIYGDDSMPGFGFELEVNDGSFSYPDLPESIQGIFVKTNIQNKTGDMDDTMIAVDRFDFSMAGNPFKSKVYLRTPISDPDLDASFSGKIDLAGLSQAMPLEAEESLSGQMEFDARFAGKMSDIENERYGRITANGFLALANFDYQSSAIELPVEIHTARFNFSPAYLDLENMHMTMGRSRMQIAGRVENYQAYYLGQGYLKGRLNLTSEILDVNELLAALPAGEIEEDTPEEAFHLPDLPENIDFVFAARADEIYYENYELKNATASITYKDQVLRFDPLTADMLAGKVEMRGLLDASDKTAAFIDMDFRISRFDIPLAYEAIGMLQQVAPVAEKARGTFSTGFKLKGKLDHELNPMYETLQGGGNLQTSQLRIESVNVMDQLATRLGNDDYKRLVTDGLDFGFEILNGRVFQKPFSINYGGTNATLGGSVGFDQQIDYSFAFQIPYEVFGAGANQAIRNIAEQASGKGINIAPGSYLNVNAKLSGLVTNPKIELDYKAAAASLRSEIEDAARRELQKQKEEALKKVSEEAERILSDAQRRSDEVISQAGATAARIRSEAAAAAEKIISEAETQATRIEDEGKRRGPLAEIAARESARKVRAEGDNSAQRVIAEADKRAEDLVKQARSQADDIMRRAQEQVERLQ